MIFSVFFEIGLLVLGALYVLNLWFDSFLHAAEVNNDLEDRDKEKADDKKRAELTQHLYS